MELEKMKTLWDEMSQEIEKQKILTDKLIMDMTQTRYKNKFSKISTYETIGAIICFITAIAILFNFKKLDTWYLMACGIFSVVYFFVLPISVLQSLRNIKAVNFAKNSYKTALLDFTKRKKNMLFIQQIGIAFNFIAMIFFLPVAGKILSNKNIFTTDSAIWYWYIPVMGIVLIFASAWGYKCYKSIANSAEKILNELKN